MSDLAVQPGIVALPDVVIRRACPADGPGLAALYQEMQVHYGRPVSDAVAAEAAAIACRPVVSLFDPRVLLAVIGHAVVGSAVLNVSFPAYELTRSLYIRDLYVAKARRRLGVGRTLVRAAVNLTADEGFSALDWTTETANHNARRMYESCGALRLERTYYRLTREDLANPD